MISIRYVGGTRGNISAFIYLLESEASQAITVGHITSLSFLRSRSFFLRLVIKHSKGYFQEERGCRWAGTRPCWTEHPRSQTQACARPLRAGARMEPTRRLRSRLAFPRASCVGGCPALAPCPAAGSAHPSRPRHGAEPRAPLGSPSPPSSLGGSRAPPAPAAGATGRHRSKPNEICKKVVQNNLNLSALETARGEGNERSPGDA